MVNLQRTLVLIKPDGVQRGLIGEIIKRFENRGLQLIAMDLRIVTNDFAENHYAAHKGKNFYKGLIKYITSAPIIAMVWEGSNAITAVRQTIGSTNPIEAAPGTIRHDLSIITSRNLVHASDSIETADKEISLWFEGNKLFAWSRVHEDWFTGLN
ncbi:MAG: nucleoside-diphosphate kinase [Candidatus Lokiarchaeota archaeon]|nr:nucleoside-diphosphate kinase [Candidatus Lokiarchaeota archaeon]